VTGAIRKLPIVILYPHSRCNCRCIMCDIWKDSGCREMSTGDLNRHLADFEKLSVEWVVLSGGEPLMHSDLFRFCGLLRERRMRVTVLTTGLLLERYAARLAGALDDLIVSLDGPPTVHDRIRRVPGAFAQLARGVEAIHRARREMPIAARTTVQRENYQHLRETAQTAKALGLESISFLAVDLTSQAFNRPEPWTAARQAEVALMESELTLLDRELEALISEWGDSRFLRESPQKLKRIALHFRAHLGLAEPAAPPCNAPWISAVVEADGTVRPCFFHAPIGRTNGSSLLDVLNGPQALAFRAGLNIAANPICRRCVCSLYR